jgi:hypothetical protein
MEAPDVAVGADPDSGAVPRKCLARTPSTTSYPRSVTFDSFFNTATSWLGSIWLSSDFASSVSAAERSMTCHGFPSVLVSSGSRA